MYRCCSRIDVSESIDVNKITASKECIISHYWYFLHKEFRFQPTVCSGCYKLFMMSIDINNITILNINAVNYRCIIVDIGRSEAISLLENVIC